MPARNERPTIAFNLTQALRAIKQGELSHVALVIDAPEDETSEIIERQLSKHGFEQQPREEFSLEHPPSGLIIVDNKRPLGKGACFVQAVNAISKQTSAFQDPHAVMVNVDADAEALNMFTVTALAARLRKHKDWPMLLGQHLEQSTSGYSVATPTSTGFRAIRLSALAPITEEHPHWTSLFPAGFGMDLALNLLFHGEKQAGLQQAEDLPLTFLRSFRHATQQDQQLQHRLVEKAYRELVVNRSKSYAPSYPLAFEAIAQHAKEAERHAGTTRRERHAK